MSLANSFQKELKAFARLLDEQTRAGMDPLQVEATHLPSLKAKIQRLKDLTVEAASELTAVVNEGHWTESGKLELCAAISCRLMQYAQPTAGRAEARANQTCLVELFLTPSQWRQLEDQSLPLGAKIAWFRDNVLLPMRLYCPTENFKGRVANLLRHVAMSPHTLQSAEDWRHFLDRVRSGLAPLGKVKSNEPHVHPYPADPDTMQSEWPELYEALYSAEEPAKREVHQLGIDPALRRTHGSLRGSPSPSPPASRHDAHGSPSWSPSPEAARIMQTTQQAMFASQPAASSLAVVPWAQPGSWGSRQQDEGLRESSHGGAWGGAWHERAWGGWNERPWSPSSSYGNRRDARPDVHEERPEVMAWGDDASDDGVADPPASEATRGHSVARILGFPPRRRDTRAAGRSRSIRPGRRRERLARGHGTAEEGDCGCKACAQARSINGIGLVETARFREGK